MNSVKSYIPLMDILRKRGYKIFIVYMDKVPKDVIIKRALERYKKSGRFVPLEVIEDFFEKGKTAFNDLKKEVDGYMVIDGSNQDYEIIEQGGIKLPTNREYSKLGSKIDPKDIPALYKKGGKTKNG
jgi:predicted ABC-type ATPase